MKGGVIRNNKKRILAFLILIVITICLKGNPDYRFFGNTLITLLICILCGRTIIKKNIAYLKYLAGLVFSMVISNNWFSYHHLSVVFPSLEKTSEAVIFYIGLGAVILTTAGSLVYRIYRERKKARSIVKKSSTEELKSCTETISASFADRVVGSVMYSTRPEPRTAAESTVNENDEGLLKNRRLIYRANGSSDIKDQGEKPQFEWKAVLGSIMAAVIVTVLMGLVIFAVIENKETLRQISNEELLELIFEVVMYLIVILLAICSFMMITISFIKAFGTIWQSGRFTMENDFVLGCISILLAIFACTFFNKATMEDFYNIMNGGSEIAALLIGVVRLILMAMMYHIIYRVLRSCVHKEGTIHQCADEILRLLAESIMNLLRKIAQTISEVPDIYDVLLEGVKGAVCSFSQFTFGDEEDYDEYNNE